MTAKNNSRKERKGAEQNSAQLTPPAIYYRARLARGLVRLTRGGPTVLTITHVKADKSAG